MPINFRVSSFNQDGDRVDAPPAIQQLILDTERRLREQVPLSSLTSGSAPSPLPAQGPQLPVSAPVTPGFQRLEVPDGVRPPIAFPNQTLAESDISQLEQNEFRRVALEDAISDAESILRREANKSERNRDTVLVQLIEASRQRDQAELAQLEQARSDDSPLNDFFSLLDASGASTTSANNQTRPQRIGRLREANDRLDFLLAGRDPDDAEDTPEPRRLIETPSGAVTSLTADQADQFELDVAFNERVTQPAIELGVFDEEANPVGSAVRSNLQSEQDFATYMAFQYRDNPDVSQDRITQDLLDDDNAMIAMLRNDPFGIFDGDNEDAQALVDRERSVQALVQAGSRDQAREELQELLKDLRSFLAGRAGIIAGRTELLLSNE